jgi:hypothetical protein
MSRLFLGAGLVAVTLLIPAPAHAQAQAQAQTQTQPDKSQWPAGSPAVTMSITLPNGQTQDVVTHESGLATVTVQGHQYGFRPTMRDEAGTRMTVTVFDMGSSTEPVKEIASVDITGGSTPVATKSTPAFKVRASKGGGQEPMTN